MNHSAVIEKPDESDRRSIPRLRSQTQDAFQRLIDVLAESGNTKLADQLKAFNRIEDAMKDDPRLIKNLIDLAWAFRSRGELRPFIAASDGTVAADENTPLGPCGETFAGLRIALLRGTARVFLNAAAKLSPEVVQASRAVGRRSSSAKTAAEEAKPSQGVVNRIKTIFGFDEKPDPKKETLRHLYPLLHDNLVADHQFALIGDYAKLEPWQVTALGEVLIGFTTSDMVVAASSLDEEHLVPLVRLARALADKALESVEAPGELVTASPKVINQDKVIAEVDLIAGQSLGHLLITHADLARPIAELDQALAEVVLKRMAHSLGKETWTALNNAKTMRNIYHCPDFLIQRLGADAKYVHEGIAEALSSVKNQEAARLLINGVLDRLGPKSMIYFMAQQNFHHWKDAFRTIDYSPFLPEGVDLTTMMAAMRINDLTIEMTKAVA